MTTTPQIPANAGTLDKPAECPFCRSTSIKAHAYPPLLDGDSPDAFCQCEGCTATGPTGSDIASAIAAWNRRAGSDEDAARLDFLDTNCHKFRMGWEVGAAPVGNLSVQAIIRGGKTIREAIDAASRREKS
jgi:hypothetical protein